VNHYRSNDRNKQSKFIAIRLPLSEQSPFVCSERLPMIDHLGNGSTGQRGSLYPSGVQLTVWPRCGDRVIYESPERSKGVASNAEPDKVRIIVDDIIVHECDLFHRNGT